MNMHLKSAMVLGLLLAAIVVYKLPLTVWTDVGKSGSEFVSWMGERGSEAFEEAGALLKREERNRLEIMVSAVRDELAPVVQEESTELKALIESSGNEVVSACFENLRAIEAQSIQEQSHARMILNNQLGIVESLTVPNPKLIEQLDRLSEETRELPHHRDEDDVAYRLHWKILEDGRSVRCRIVPAADYKLRMGEVLENRVIVGKAYKLVRDSGQPFQPRASSRL